MLSKKTFNTLIAKTTIKCGCYLFKDENDHILYVGKAKNIHKRIQQHFNAISENKKTYYMFTKVCKWQTIITNNEKEAFILEHNLIKKYFPKFNILLTDDHTYPYIFISKERKHPRYLLLWKKINENGWYFGPFTNIYSGRKILSLLQKLFPLKRCLKRKEKKKCLYYQIQQCSGACFQEVKKTYYDQQIKKVKNFFDGHVQNIKKKYQKEITIAVKNLQFEQAQRYQKLINKIDAFTNLQTMEIKNCENHHFVNFASDQTTILITIFFYQKNKLQLRKEAKFNLFNNNIQDTIDNYLQELYEFHPFPKYLVLPEKIASKMYQKIWKLKILYPKKGNKMKVLNLLYDNAQELLKTKALEDKQNQQIKILKNLKNLLNIKNEITKITFLDFSYQDQKIIVAAFTNYINGYWNKNLNFRYFLKSQKKNETSYCYLAIKKYYQKRNLPELLILDGSYAQLKGTKKALEELNKTTSLICLTKNKQHRTNLILKDDGTKINLQDKPQILNFLQKIQENGDRYAKKILMKKNMKMFFLN